MPQHPFRSRVALVGVAVVVLGASSSLSGCAVIASATAQHTQVFYPTLSTASPAAQAEVPDFIPKDATDVTIRTLPGHGKTLKFVSTTALDPGLCHAGALSGRPRVNSNWWPTGLPPADGTVCDAGWQLFQRDGETFGWTAK